ncbi:adult-specific rigid cuticular protein 11.9-like isoform X2 [Tachypleus tridentatus]|uniref:adult-specific rigid cuticular protein 11.9-like isoform X2 n=1 Tax=Tachypleus tridentatus TaxID=6853 RepID=UPI003FD6B38A
MIMFSRYHSQTDRGTYNFGYDTGSFGAHSFHHEERDDNGIVRGRYGYTDPYGKLRIVQYEAGPFGYRPK